MQQRLIFRVDANRTIGRGHVSRCLAIALMLKENIDILFVSLKINESYVSGLLGDFESEFIKREEDIKEIVNQEDLLWIDGYHFSEDWKKGIQPYIKKLIETNDIPYTPKYVDILFNHTPGLTEIQFGGDACEAELYLGLNYALLRQQFLKYAKKNETTVNGRGVFVCFGGADTYNLGKKFVSELIRQGFEDPIYWVTNSKDVNSNEYNENVSILSNLNEDEMILYMSKAKVVLIPSSVLSFEAMALHKPIFTCYFVDNQQLINEGLLRDELASSVGLIKTSNDVKDGILLFLEYYENTYLHKKQIKKQFQLLDGKSASRITEIIVSL